MDTQLDALARGIGVGALCVVAWSTWRSPLKHDARLATLLSCLSTSAWIVTESAQAWNALGRPLPLLALAFPVAGLFWLMVAAVFEERRVNAATLAPSIALVVAGLTLGAAPRDLGNILWFVFNLFSGALCLHAAFIVLQGWRGDLVETRRQSRALILAFAALFSTIQGVTAILLRVDPHGPWSALAITQPAGAAVIGMTAVAMGGFFLQGRPALFGATRRPVRNIESAAETAERVLLEKLKQLMASGAWQREGLAIADVARDLATPEHRLRRLINGQLGHRNFSDFVNSYRIEAAKLRLADPTDAHTSVAAIAFAVGYGSIGPFNRAFRAATDQSPTQWRRTALQTTPDLDKSG